MLDRSSALASHCKHTINFVDQLVSKHVIGFVDIHRFVSINMSVNMSVNATESKDVKHVNKIDSNVLCDGIFFQKR